MAYCRKCGAAVGNEDKFCTNCGAPIDRLPAVDSYGYTQPQSTDLPQRRGYTVTGTDTPPRSGQDTGGFLWGFLGFLLPMAGLVLFIMWNKTRPRSAKAAGIGALISVVLNVLLLCSIGGLDALSTYCILPLLY